MNETTTNETPGEATVSSPEGWSLPKAPWTMPPRAIEHLGRVLKSLAERVRERYRKGQFEHGDFLEERKGIVVDLREELIDAMVYMSTLDEQAHTLIRDMESGDVSLDIAAVRLRAIFDR